MKKIFFASIALTTFAASLLLFQMTSCKKATAQISQTTTYQIAGLWTGTYSVNSIPSQGQLFYSFIIYKDGTIVTRSVGSDGKYYYTAGTWTVSATNAFSATVTSFVTPNSGSPVTQTIIGTFSNSGAITEATWRDTNNPNGAGLAGSFSNMLRIN